MGLPIVTLIVGILIVCISFFVLDGHNYKEEDEIYKETSEELKLRLMELCDTLVEQNKASITEYSQDIREKQEKELKEELEKCADQLSEKAKKEMIDYINQSLTEAFEAYNPEAEEKPEPIQYDETVEDKTQSEASPIEEVDAEDKEQTEDIEISEDVQENKAEASVSEEQSEELEIATNEDDAEPDASEVEQTVESETTEEDATDSETTEEAQTVESETSVETQMTEPDISVEKGQVEEPTADSDKEESVQSGKDVQEVKPEQKKGKGKKKNRNKNKSKKQGANQVKEEIKAEEIWDDEKDTEAEVARLYEEGYGMMEIANQLGIGVGEAKVIINQLKNK